MKNKKPYKRLDDDDLDFISSIVSDIDIGKTVKVYSNFSSSLQAIRTVLRNYFPKPFAFSVIKQQVRVDKLTARLKLTDWPKGFLEDTEMINYVKEETINIIDAEFSKKPWREHYHRLVDIQGNNVEGEIKLELKRSESL